MLQTVLVQWFQNKLFSYISTKDTLKPCSRIAKKLQIKVLNTK